MRQELVSVRPAKCPEKQLQGDQKREARSCLASLSQIQLLMLSYADSAEAPGTDYSAVLVAQRNLRTGNLWLRTLRRQFLP